MENNFWFRSHRSCPRKPSVNNFFGSMNFHGNPPQFCKVMYFFLGTGSHKPVTCNVLWERFKMGNDRKLIDAKQYVTGKLFLQLRYFKTMVMTWYRKTLLL